MAKYNYFEQLEHISCTARQAVRQCCSALPSDKQQSFVNLRQTCDRRICELEEILFSDFLPPLERDSIATCAHCLSRIVEQATEVSLFPPSSAPAAREEGKICIRLADELHASVTMLRTITKPEEIPNVKGYRQMLGEGRKAHQAALEQLRSGKIARSEAQNILQTGRLRLELSRAFDEVVEIMLNNI